MIFSKPVEDLDIEDIRMFCGEGVKEGFTIDYKVDLPGNNRDLAKTVCAFANTWGGIILVGIDEDRTTGKPLLDASTGEPIIDGIALGDGLYDRVMSIILGNIHPPLFPDIAVVPFDNDAKAVIIIRIPESDHTPYAIDNNRSVYVRTDSMNKPEERATVDKLEWLWERRGKAKQFRQIIYESAKDRVMKIYERPDLWVDEGSSSTSPVPGRATFSAVPLFPDKGFASASKMKELFTTCTVPGRIYSSFPWFNRHLSLRTTQHSIIHYFGLRYNKPGDRMPGLVYHELSCYGLVFYQEPLIVRLEDDTDVIRCSNIIHRLDQFLTFIDTFYKELGMLGQINIRISIEDIFGLKMIEDAESWWHLWFSHDLDFEREVVVNRNQLAEQKIDILTDIIREACATFNFDVSDEQIEKYQVNAS